MEDSEGRGGDGVGGGGREEDRLRKTRTHHRGCGGKKYSTFSKSYILGFAFAVFLDSPPGGRLNHDDFNLEQFTNMLISRKLPKT